MDQDNYFKQLLKDNSGRYSLAKSLLAVGFLVVTGVFISYAVLGTLTYDFIVTYIMFISGHTLVSKGIDKFGTNTADKP
jgi:hypothetical protein